MPTFPILLLALAPTNDPVPAPGEVRCFPLAGALPAEPGSCGGTSLVPTLRSWNGGEIDERSRCDPGQVLELLRTLDPEEWEFEGRELGLREDGRLLVRAPAELVEKTQQMLAFLERSNAATIDLAIDVVTLPRGASAPALPSTLAAGDVDARIQALAPQGRRSTYRLAMAPGAEGTIRATTQVEMVSDYNVEVAQGAWIHDPVVDTVEAGLVLTAVTAPAPGGTWLSLVARDLVELGPPQAREDGYGGTVGNEQKITDVRGPRVRQAMSLANRSLAIDTFLGTGRALVLQTKLDLSDAIVETVVFVRQTNAGRPSVMRWPIAGPPGNAPVLLETGTFAPAHVSLDGALADASAHRPRWHFDEESGQEPLLYAGVMAASCDEAMSLAYADGVSFDSVGPWLQVSRDRGLEQGADPVQPVLDLIAHLAPEPRLLQVELRLERGGASVARTTFALREGSHGAAVVGREGCMLTDFNVEVAQDAAVAEPIVATTFEGLVATLRPARGASGGWTLDLGVNACVPRGAARRFDTGSSSIGTIEQQDLQRLDGQHRLTAAPDGGPTKRFVLGDSSGSPEALALVVELTEVR